MAEYELIDELNGMRYSHSWIRIAALVLLYLVTTIVVFVSWNSIYDKPLYYPPHMNDVPEFWYRRARLYANSSVHDVSHDFRLVKNQTTRLPLQSTTSTDVSYLPSFAANTSMEYKNATVENAINPDEGKEEQMRLVCYYVLENVHNKFNYLRLTDVNASLCTHIHVGMANVENCTIIIEEEMKKVLTLDVPVLRWRNPSLKVLLWVGGGGNSDGFPTMIKNHTSRKLFVHSLKEVLSNYELDGVDLDWEFPSAYNKERQHFSQLLYEIKAEYRREHKNYQLSVAVAAPEGIALFAYDIRELNLYADYVNVMTYDYHFYSHDTPFTGLNAPLYALRNEHSIMATLNINYSINWWLTNGLDRKKLVVGLPTYGHSFELVNAFNNGIGAPSRDVGRCGRLGFVSYSELCWFHAHNLFVTVSYDEASCSPYLSSGTEWISFENEMSIECKARFVKSHNLGGAMIFSLNTDDTEHYCIRKSETKFPLIEIVRNVLSSKR